MQAIPFCPSSLISSLSYHSYFPLHSNIPSSQHSSITFFVIHSVKNQFKHHFVKHSIRLCCTQYYCPLAFKKKSLSDTLCQLSLRPTLLVPCNLVSVSLSLEHHYSIHSVKLSLRIVLLLARHCSPVKSQTSHHFCCTT